MGGGVGERCVSMSLCHKTVGVLQRNIQRLVELQRDLEGLDDVCSGQRVTDPCTLLPSIVICLLVAI